jgi:hypothetical protein
MKFVSNIIKLYGFEKQEKLRDKLSFSETEPLTLSLSLSLFNNKAIKFKSSEISL